AEAEDRVPPPPVAGAAARLARAGSGAPIRTARPAPRPTSAVAHARRPSAAELLPAFAPRVREPVHAPRERNGVPHGVHVRPAPREPVPRPRAGVVLQPDSAGGAPSRRAVQGAPETD